jgi:glutathione S-transferase
MLELYHHGSSVCAAKVRLALDEKGVEVDRYHYVDILRGEQFAPEFLEINPSAVVPALVHDGRAVNESTLICEYIDHVFPGRKLQPEDPYELYRMKLWTKAVDELLHPACADVTYVACHRHIILRLGPQELEAYFESTPEQSVKGGWRQRKRELVTLGFEAPGIEAKFRLYDAHLAKMEAALGEHAWLAGDAFSLADISLAPYVNRLAMLSMSGLWEGGRLPRVADWFARVKGRPTFQRALLDWCPAELTEDLARYGAASWPTVREIVAL